MSRLGSDFNVISGCRSCGDVGLETILDLGLMPLSDGLVRQGFDRDDELLYPLTLAFCQACSLSQIRETVRAQTLFGGEYPYYSSFSPYLLDHSRENVEELIERTSVDEGSLVVEVASNDGYLLQWFQKAGVPVLGIDPAPGPASVARGRGIETIGDFFTKDLASDLLDEGVQADIIVGNNVLAHVPDLNDFVAGLATLLAPDGTVVMEFPYVKDLIDKVEFDTIYHEHHCYFSVRSVEALFARHGLTLVSVRRLSIHGGSLRVFFQKGGAPDQSVIELLAEEKAAGVLEPQYYRNFAGQVEDLREKLLTILDGLKAEGMSLAAYGAAAKGAILLNYCGLGPDRIDYVVDRNKHKHGWEMPGVEVSIHHPDELRSNTPDALLVLAWNFADEIMSQQSWFSDEGGRFIIPVPEPRII